MNEKTLVAGREPEILNQINTLRVFCDNLEETVKKYQDKLANVVNNAEMCEVENGAVNPECSSRLGIELMNIHSRLCKSGQQLEELLKRVEL